MASDVAFSGEPSIFDAFASSNGDELHFDNLANLSYRRLRNSAPTAVGLRVVASGRRIDLIDDFYSVEGLPLVVPSEEASRGDGADAPALVVTATLSPNMHPGARRGVPPGAFSLTGDEGAEEEGGLGGEADSDEHGSVPSGAGTLDEDYDPRSSLLGPGPSSQQRASSSSSSASASASSSPPTNFRASICEWRLVYFYFCMLGIGVAVAWTTLRSGLSYFSAEFGGSFYTYMSVAYNVPILPLLILQLLFDSKADAFFGARQSYEFRLVFSMVGMAACLAAVPFGGRALTLSLVALVGVFDSVCFGSATAFFPVFPPIAGGFYFIGASLSSVVTLALCLATGFNTAAEPRTPLIETYAVAGAFVVAGLVASIALGRSRVGRYFFGERDRQLAERSSSAVAARDRASARRAVEAAAAERSKRLLLEAPPPPQQRKGGAAAGGVVGSQEEGRASGASPTEALPPFSKSSVGRGLGDSERHNLIFSAESSGGLGSSSVIAKDAVATGTTLLPNAVFDHGAQGQRQLQQLGVVAVRQHDAAAAAGGVVVVGGSAAASLDPYSRRELGKTPPPQTVTVAPPSVAPQAQSRPTSAPPLPSFSSSSAVSKARPTSSSSCAILRETYLCHVSIFLGWVTTTCVDSLLGFVPSSADTPASRDKSFRILLVYASLLAELLGKQLNLSAYTGWLLAGPKRLAIVVSLRFVAMFAYLAYIAQPLYLRDGGYAFTSNAGAVAFVFINDMTGSYLSTTSYKVFPSLLSNSNDRSKAGTLLSISLTVGLYAGLGFSVALSQMLGAAGDTAG